ncbi:MAG: hypothetical protein V4640_10885 [Verrucomicrobiota bacterium]
MDDDPFMDQKSPQSRSSILVSNFLRASFPSQQSTPPSQIPNPLKTSAQKPNFFPLAGANEIPILPN